MAELGPAAPGRKAAEPRAGQANRALGRISRKTRSVWASPMIATYACCYGALLRLKLRRRSQLKQLLGKTPRRHVLHERVPNVVGFSRETGA